MASARTCLARMATDMESAYIADYPLYRVPEFDDPPDPYRIVGDATDLAGIHFSRLQFTSLAHLVLNRDPRQGIARIIYYADQLPDDSLVLRRADDLYPFPEFEESEDDPILCDHLLDLKLVYVDDEGETQEQWDSESADNAYATPRSVEVRLKVGTSSRPILFTTRIPLHVYRKAKE
ncbi:type II secretion system protein GspJ [Desulfosarcina cetonica]|uniref:type II secretion system protein GspJ n=1 Tax=Desulfosarcina cetonica TaxID=90730 RepID=UPI0009FB67A7|nr:type II secretion system protein GspJ [Desulfosarcina cetonica]